MLLSMLILRLMQVISSFGVSKMNLSGIAVSVQPRLFDDTVSRISELPGVDVHYQDPDSARLVVVQEACNVDAEVEGLKRIKSIHGVVVAELVYHYFADDPTLDNSRSPDSDTACTISESVLRRLNSN